MKTITILIVGIILLYSQACHQEKQKDNAANEKVEKTEAKIDTNKVVFQNLDQILSPFEDMVEFALEKNEEGISNSFTKVEEAIKEEVFSKNLNPENMKLLTPKIEQLKGFVKLKNYEQIALAATDIFEFNISNFVDTKKIENQIRIEHLDYMGFKILALLNQEKIDWQNIEQTISSVQKEWSVLSPNVKDNNLKDSFEYLFNGLHLSAKNKDQKMAEILSSMDLSLVDVLENSF